MILKAERNLKAVYDSGQCFRWTETKEGYLAVVGNHYAFLKQIDESHIRIDCDDPFWKDYFDLDTDYGNIRSRIAKRDKFLINAAEEGRGICILRQDPWEMLVSSIISQRKSIPAIRSTLRKICRREIGEGIYAFPAPEEILSLGENGLREAGAGYRIPYLLGTAEKFAGGEFNIGELNGLKDADLKKKLMELPGVGTKVADCTMLFGFHRLNAFPVDVWIERALAEHYPKGFPFQKYKPYCGVLQQYMFYAYMLEKQKN